jgi:hypothetical protein
LASFTPEFANPRGFTWARVGDPITGNGRTTGGSTFNNDNGPIVADPRSNMLYDVYTYRKASGRSGKRERLRNVV